MNSAEMLGRLREHRNVVVHPAVPYRELSSVIHAFDVAIVPHLINEYTRGNDLLKVLDYLACGVPCVSTDCSNVRKYGSALYVADSADDSWRRCARCSTVGSTIPTPGLTAARAASWERTVPELGQWLATRARLRSKVRRGAQMAADAAGGSTRSNQISRQYG